MLPATKLFRLLLVLSLLVSSAAFADNYDKVQNFRAGIQLDSVDVTSTAAELNLTDASAMVGAVATPASGTVAVSESRVGNLVTTTFTLTDAQLSVSSDTGGSYAALKIYDLPAGAVKVLGCRMNVTNYTEGETLSGAAGDVVHEIGVGMAAISAVADGALGATEDDVCGDINGTDSEGAQTLSGLTGDGSPTDGTATAKDFYLNFSGTDATVDASDTLDVTGTITISWLFLGDH